jgi:hypothetical protein
MFLPLTSTDLPPALQEHEPEALEQALPLIRANESELWYISLVLRPCSQDVRLDNESVLRLLRQGQSQMQCSASNQLVFQD